METVRSIEVRVVVDTNKDTYVYTQVYATGAADAGTATADVAAFLARHSGDYDAETYRLTRGEGSLMSTAPSKIEAEFMPDAQGYVRLPASTLLQIYELAGFKRTGV